MYAKIQETADNVTKITLAFAHLRYAVAVLMTTLLI